MRQENKTLLYGLAIGLSVLDLIAVIGCAARLLISAVQGHMAAQTFNATYDPSRTLVKIIEVAVIVVGIVCYPVLTKWRQKLRDEVEYDEDGVSKKHGKFSQLSTKERKEIDLQTTMDNERILSATTVKSIKRDVYKDPETELNNLIGLSSVKTEVKKREARMKYELERMQVKSKKKVTKVRTASNMHCIFTGNPGTGKTTVARIVASYLYQYHFIEKPYYFEIDGNFFNGLTIGEASKKVTLLCRAARGSCIYIDEAYALCSSRTQEVIASLVKQMEDNADSIVFIYSGYKKEMQEFLDSNSGIKSRIKYWFNFEDYSDYELGLIFNRMVQANNLVPSYELTDEVAATIGARRSQSNFGNAREVRNEVDRLIDNHAYNLANGLVDASDKYRLTLKDL